MCIGAKPPSPPPPPPPPELPVVPKPTDKEITATRNKARAQAALARGRQDTILTSGMGLTTPAPTAPKTVLGA